MASILLVGGRWRAQVRLRGAPSRSVTFDSREQAEAWATKVERQYRANPIPDEIADLPRHSVKDGCGVYFLFRGGECVYVGQSRKAHYRVMEHVGRIAFVEYSVLHVAPENLDATEQKYIRKLQPIHNVRGNYEMARRLGWKPTIRGARIASRVATATIES